MNQLTRGQRQQANGVKAFTTLAFSLFQIGYLFTGGHSTWQAALS